MVLDTHAWIWWTDDKRNVLSSKALMAIEAAEAICVSALSCWEIATLTRRGRITLDRPAGQWVTHARTTLGVEVIPVDERIATVAGELSDDFPGDPSDRIIYATALLRGAPLVTRDNAIRAFDPARTIW